MKAYDVTPEAFAQLIDRVNALYQAADIRFLFDPLFDWAPMANTLINTDGDGQVGACNAIAANIPGKLVCFLRWGGSAWRTGNGNAYPPAGIAPEPKNMPGRVQNYVMLPNQIAPNFGLLNQGNGSFVAHELGHYLGLYHTFPGWDGYNPVYSSAGPSDPLPAKEKIDQALLDYVAANGGAIDALNGDGLSDTPPDPSPIWYAAHGLDLCTNRSTVVSGTAGGKKLSLTLAPEPNNIMSYFGGCPSSNGPNTAMHFSAQQIAKMKTTLKHVTRKTLIESPTFGARSLQLGSAVALGAGELMVLAQDTSGRAWFTHWRQGGNENRWDRWRPILTSTGQPNGQLAAVSRASGKLDIFSTGTDGKTYTAAWESARANGQWRGWWNILGGAIPPGGSVSAVSRRTDHLDVFLVSNDGGIYTASWNPGMANQQWQGWSRIGALKAKPGTRVAAVSRGPDKLDIFVAGEDGKTYTAAWDKAQANGQWRGWWNILGGAVPSGGTVSVIARRPEQLDIFLVSNDGGVYTASWNRNVANQQWQGWWRIGGAVATPGAPVSVVSRSPDKLDIFVAGKDGKTYTAAWDANQANGQWRGWWNILSGFLPAGSAIAAVARDPGKLSLFITSNDGAIYTAAWDRDVANQQWQGWWKIGG